MKKSILLLILICPFLQVSGQTYFGGSIGFSQNGFSVIARDNPSGIFINAELKKIIGMYSFSLESEINQYNFGVDRRVGYRIIYKPINLNFDYHFLIDKKLSPYAGVGIGIANTRNEIKEVRYGVISEFNNSGSSICASIRSGLLIDSKVGKINIRANYCYIDNQYYYPNRVHSSFLKRRGHILNLGVGMLFEI